jgi:hypothetical protein
MAIREGFTSSAPGPDLICVLNRALVGGRLLVDAPEPPPFPVGHVFLREDGEDVIATVSAGDRFETKGRHTYPVVPHGTDRFLGDPARALLLFVEAVCRRLAEQQGLELPVMTEYLTEETRHVTWLPD